MKFGIEFGLSREEQAHFMAKPPYEVFGLPFEIDEPELTTQYSQEELNKTESRPQAKHLATEAVNFVKVHPAITLVAGVAAVIAANKINEHAHKSPLPNPLQSSV